MDINGPKSSVNSSRPDTPPGNKESKGDGVQSSKGAEAASRVGEQIGAGKGQKRESDHLVLGANEAVLDKADRVEALPAVRDLKGRDEAVPHVVYADAHKLLAHIGEAHRDGVVSLREWEINFALLHSAYQKTDDPELKQKIRFLMTNYLQKTAYFNTHMKFIESEKLGHDYQDLLQYGQMTLGGMYHRTADSMIHHLISMDYERKFGAGDFVDNYIPLDTEEIDHLYDLNFRSQLDISDTASVVDAYTDQFTREKSGFPDDMKVPILIDVSKEIGDSLFTDEDPAKIAAYVEKRDRIKAQVLGHIDLAVAAIKLRHPDIDMSDDELQTYLLMNTIVVAKGPVREDFSVMSLLSDMFDDKDFKAKSIPKIGGGRREIDKFDRNSHLKRNKIFPWSNGTGIGLGAVRYREELARSYADPEALVALGGRATTWAKDGGYTSMMYHSPRDILKSHGLKHLKKIGAEEQKFGKGQAVLASGTVQMMETLFARISDEKWEAVQNDPAAREVVQNAMVRMMHHIGDANISTKDFRKYTQAIDRIHAELTTILLLMEPFEEGVFEQEYGKYIQDLFPSGLKPSVVGIGKAAMSVYSGVNAAVVKNNPHPVRVFGEHTYYEQTGLFGNTSMEEVLTDPAIEKVDVFTAEFYHNINPDVHDMRYQRENLQQDIKEILHRKPSTDALTVVVDSTLDLTKSEDHKELFHEFEEEIREGRINFVMIRSGQKYDMLGLDNYFGAPFYIVNNGDPKWADVNAIKTQKAHQTDGLSNQYFRWMAASNPKIMDDYKKRIFKNTRKILNAVPPGLKPQRGREVVISKMDTGVSTPFFEIAANLEDKSAGFELMMWMHNKFTDIFVSKGKLVYARGSFGFAHPNFTMIGNKIRINPGLDPSDLPLYKEFFVALEKKLKELKD